MIEDRCLFLVAHEDTAALFDDKTIEAPRQNGMGHDGPQLKRLNERIGDRARVVACDPIRACARLQTFARSVGVCLRVLQQVKVAIKRKGPPLKSGAGLQNMSVDDTIRYGYIPRRLTHSSQPDGLR